MDYHRYFFGQQILEVIVQQSNLYAEQNNPNKPQLLIEMEIKQFLEAVLTRHALLWQATDFTKFTAFTMWLILCPVIDGRKSKETFTSTQIHSSKLEKIKILTECFKIRPLFEHLQKKVQRTAKVNIYL